MASSMSIRSRFACVLLLGLVGQVGAGASAPADPVPPPDLRLEWRLDERAARRGPAIEGLAGEVVRLPYVLRNVGGAPAYAAVIEIFTQLGPVGRKRRIQPGPKAGEEMDRFFDLPLARGVREVCVVVRLQNLGIEDPSDPHPDDNRLCRPVHLAEGEGSAESSTLPSKGNL